MFRDTFEEQRGFATLLVIVIERLNNTRTMPNELVAQRRADDAFHAARALVTLVVNDTELIAKLPLAAATALVDCSRMAWDKPTTRIDDMLDHLKEATLHIYRELDRTAMASQ